MAKATAGPHRLFSLEKKNLKTLNFRRTIAQDFETSIQTLYL